VKMGVSNLPSSKPDREKKRGGVENREERCPLAGKEERQVTKMGKHEYPKESEKSTKVVDTKRARFGKASENPSQGETGELGARSRCS